MSELLRVEELKKYFKTTDGYLHAVDDVSFSIRGGETLGVVGESGCGKSTLGRVVLHLLDATEGKIFYDGEDITSVSSAQLKELRKQMQIIFQDPFSSLNPRMTVEEIIEEPLRIYNLYRESGERNRHVEKLMDVVGLAKRLRRSYPHELDGGRRQRIGIARALALRPRFIVCDEPVSALDVSIQAQILNLLQDLQEDMQLTYLFITHDLSVVKHFSNRICVMYLGKVMEIGDVDELFENPLHPYTQALLSAIPIPDPDAPRNRILLRGEISSPINPKPGCRFAQRCNYATAACSEKDPELRQVADNHWVACVRAGR